MTAAAAHLALLALLAGASAAGAQPRDFTLSRTGPGLARISSADPSAVVAAEIARAKLMREQGVQAGLRQTADKDAVLFVPDIVNAPNWLKKRAPARFAGGTADRVFLSCDGGYGLALGHIARPDGGVDGYATLWRQQKDGSYKWLLDWITRPPTRDADEGVEGKVADCPARAGPGSNLRPDDPHDDPRRGRRAQLPIVRIANPPPARGAGQSPDGTLRWQWESKPDGARALTVAIRYSGGDLILLDDRFVPGAP